MIGTTPIERARVRRLERMADIGVLGRVARWVHNRKSPLPGVKGNPAVVTEMEETLVTPLRVIDAEIGDRPFVAGDRPTIADCTLFGALEFGRFGGFELDAEYANIHRWWAAFSERPSAQIAPPS